MKPDNYITRQQKPDPPKPIWVFRVSLSSVIGLRQIRFGKHFTQNQKLGFHRKVVRFDFTRSIWPGLVISATKIFGDENHRSLSTFLQQVKTMEVPKLFSTEINASKCFVISLIENCQNQDDIDRWITVVVDRWWWKTGMSGGRGESGGRGRDGGAVVVLVVMQGAVAEEETVVAVDSDLVSLPKCLDENEDDGGLASVLKVVKEARCGFLKGQTLLHSRSSYSSIHTRLEAELMGFSWAIDCVSDVHVVRVVFESSSYLAGEAILNLEKFPQYRTLLTTICTRDHLGCVPCLWRRPWKIREL
ncbi:hypothetical protein YC2023_073784 [Brassica napus]